MSGTVLSLCMIVKDEAHQLARALNSVRDLADELLVVDTGSTDGTPDLAAELGARVVSFDWTGSFADARNFALEQARGDWALILDADEALHPDDAGLLRNLVADPAVEAYIVTVVNFLGDGADALNDHRVSLLRRRPEYRYRGALHEQLQDCIRAARPDAAIAVTPLRILHYGYMDDEMGRKGKRQRNRAILEARLAENPTDAFLQYALAVECLALGEAGKAAALLESVLTANGAADIRSDALMKRAACARLLGDADAARLWLERTVEEYPDFTDAWFDLAGLYSTVGRRQEAETCLRLCLALREPPAQYQSLAGVGGWRAWLALGAVYEAKGRRAAARRAYWSCLQVDPANRDALEGLTALLAAEPAAAAREELSQGFDLNHAETALGLAVAFRRRGTPLHAYLLLGGVDTEQGYLERARCLLDQVPLATGTMLPHSPQR